MAVKTAQYIFNGQAYNLTYNSTSGKWEATVTAPSKLQMRPAILPR